MSTMFKRIDTVFLKVKDFESTIDWYSTVLGFTVRWKDEVNGYAALNIGETPLTLVRSTEVISNSNVSFNFFSADIQEAHNHLMKYGVRTEPIQDEGNVKWFKFQDLEGNKLEVCSFKE